MNWPPPPPGWRAFFTLVTLVTGAEDRNPLVFTRYHPSGDLICALIRASHAFCSGFADLGSWLSHQGDGLKSVGWETAAFSLSNFPLSTLDRLCRCVLQLWNVTRAERCWWDEGGQWGRAEDMSRPCSFLPVSPHRPSPILLFLTMAADLCSLQAVLGLLSLSPEKSVS